MIEMPGLTPFGRDVVTTMNRLGTPLSAAWSPRDARVLIVSPIAATHLV